MNGISFVKAVFFWLMMMAIGFCIVGLAVSYGSVWLLAASFSVIWIILTLRWAWLLGSSDE